MASLYFNRWLNCVKTIIRCCVKRDESLQFVAVKFKRNIVERQAYEHGQRILERSN
jgi:hypothetical protein